jgi:microcystin-dependent protein
LFDPWFKVKGGKRMTTPYIGEIRMFAGNFAPVDWAFCWGQTLQISQYDVLFSLIGNTYGGDGVQTFSLPDLRGRVPIHMGTQGGNTYNIGQAGGSETVTLSVPQMPAHSHTPTASSVGNSTTPGGNVWANSQAKQFIEPLPGNLNATMAAGMTAAGSSDPHANMIPFLAINFIICLNGLYPVRE